MWRSLVAHLTGGQGAAGSNPAIPTITNGLNREIGWARFSSTLQRVCNRFCMPVQIVLECLKVLLTGPVLGLEERAMKKSGRSERLSVYKVPAPVGKTEIRTEAWTQNKRIYSNAILENAEATVALVQEKLDTAIAASVDAADSYCNCLNGTAAADRAAELLEELRAKITESIGAVGEAESANQNTADDIQDGEAAIEAAEEALEEFHEAIDDYEEESEAPDEALMFNENDDFS